MSTTKKIAIKLLDSLPEEKLKETITFMKFLQEKEEWEATEEILKDKKLMSAWKKGKKEVEERKTGNWESVKKRLFTAKGKSLKNV
jgi:hypothetical protein